MPGLTIRHISLKATYRAGAILGKHTGMGMTTATMRTPSAIDILCRIYTFITRMRSCHSSTRPGRYQHNVPAHCRGAHGRNLGFCTLFLFLCQLSIYLSPYVIREAIEESPVIALHPVYSQHYRVCYGAASSHVCPAHTAYEPWRFLLCLHWNIYHVCFRPSSTSSSGPRIS